MVSRGYTTGGDRISVYDPSLNSTYTQGPWVTCPLQEYIHDPSIGVYLNESWINYDATNDYTLTQAVAGTAAISTAAPGVLEIDSNSTTATQGVNLQRLGACFLPAAGKDIWFECKFKVVDTYDKAEIFVGLANSDTTIIATSANSSTDHIGWQCVTDDGVLLFTSEKGGTGTTSACATIAEDTYIKLGFYVNGVTSVQQYVNDVATGTAHATANVPILAMFPSFVCQSGGTNDPIMHVAGYRVFQLR
jgi:hypothetical protein